MTGAPKPTRSARTLPMPPDVLAALRAFKTRQAEERLALGGGWPDTGLVAVNADGSPIRPETYSKAFAAHCAAAGVPVIRLHDVRHTAATMLLDGGNHAVGDGQVAGPRPGDHAAGVRPRLRRRARLGGRRPYGPAPRTRRQLVLSTGRTRLRRAVGGRQYDAGMSAPLSDDAPGDEPSAAQPGTDEDFRPRFHQRDAAAIADEAALGKDGPLHVARVQDFYRQIFELVEDEAWSDDPVGPLGDQWRGVGGAQSTYYLLNVAGVLYELMAKASPGVGRTITQRLKTVLRPTDDHAYEEALVELETGGMLASRVSPVLLEPLVPRDWRPGQGEQPMSPDYGLRVPEGLVTVEVTVWHWEAYAAWQRMNDAIHTALSARMMKRGVARNVRIELPIGSPQEVVKDLWSHEFCEQVCDNDYGEIVTTDGAAPRPIRATWRPMLHFADPDNIDWDAVAANGGPPFAAGPGVGQMFGYAVNPCIGDDDLSAALESLRRSIDRKKRQRDPNLPHFVAIASTFPRIAVGPNEFANTWDVFGPLIEERLWPNARYSWLSGVLHHRTSRVAAPGNLAYLLDYNPNPNTEVPAPETLMRALTGETEFHAMWQRPRRTEAGPLPARNP